MPREAIERRLEEISARFDMKEFLDSRCERLSSGQRQKISIGRTIIHDPPVLILDEPTAGLDVLAAAEIVRFIRQARSEGRCILLSTHIMREAEKLCDRIAILHEGRIQACGTLEQLYQTMQTTDLEEVFMRVVRSGRVVYWQPCWHLFCLLSGEKSVLSKVTFSGRMMKWRAWDAFITV